MVPVRLQGKKTSKITEQGPLQALKLHHVLLCVIKTILTIMRSGTKTWEKGLVNSRVGWSSQRNLCAWEERDLCSSNRNIESVVNLGRSRIIYYHHPSGNSYTASALNFETCSTRTSRISSSTMHSAESSCMFHEIVLPNKPHGLLVWKQHCGRKLWADVSTWIWHNKIITSHARQRHWYK
jgi:hypothetical protein